MYDGLGITMNSKLLNGSQRVVVDGFLSDEECRALQRLTNVSSCPSGPSTALWMLWEAAAHSRVLVQGGSFSAQLP